MDLVSCERIRYLFDYCSETGIFIRKVGLKNSVKTGIKVGSVKKGHLTLYVDKRRYMLHRLIWLHYYGKYPEGVIDHINGNGFDNRICNLRDCSVIQNTWNQRMPKNNTSGVKGVSWAKNESKWLARIQANRKREHIGYFNNIEDAKEAYKKRSKELYGEYSSENR